MLRYHVSFPTLKIMRYLDTNPITERKLGHRPDRLCRHWTQQATGERESEGCEEDWSYSSAVETSRLHSLQPHMELVDCTSVPCIIWTVWSFARTDCFNWTWSSKRFLLFFGFSFFHGVWGIYGAGGVWVGILGFGLLDTSLSVVQIFCQFKKILNWYTLPHLGWLPDQFPATSWG